MTSDPFTTPVDPYHPPLGETHAPFVPPPEADPARGDGDRRQRGLLRIVIGLAVVLCLGAAVVAGQLWPAEETAAKPDASAAAWPDLPALPGSAETGLRAADGGPATQIRFVNTTGGKVVIAWLGYDGKRSDYATLDPGQTYEQQTFVGHVWVAATVDGEAIAVFQPTAQPGRAVIGQRPE
ncbi:hypothetical protein Aph02nite_31650 [Actinoplanes philippinensis]|uniref:VHL beta domain-containing protein n=1 Tax=Actinoplanes philippinensis TaxID=35752 RepID=UPI0015A5BF97|nr:hypothetical protein [Actinoplanes philippinensis]GIE77215.1 hypothetical protein Aph02nite_31650 [Actinoplanes philippinensis]